jgi:SpoVK/Ycf46/Vps4 family AAA+-type ATPase
MSELIQRLRHRAFRPRVTQADRWSLEDTSLKGQASKLVALMLIALTRRMPSLVPTYKHSEFGAFLWPVFYNFRDQWRYHWNTLKPSPSHSTGADSDDDPDTALQDPAPESLSFEDALAKGKANQWVGQQLASSDSEIQSLLGLMEDALDQETPVHPNTSHLCSALSLDSAQAALLDLALCLNASGVNESLFDFIERAPHIRSALQVLVDLTTNASASENEALASSSINSLIGDANGQAFGGLLVRGPSLTRVDFSEMLGLSPLGRKVALSVFKDSKAMAQALLLPITFQDFDHAPLVAGWPEMREAVTWLPRALQSALAERQCGINILFYGAPGTGKTSFARRLVRQIASHGFWVSSQGDQAGMASSEQRLAHLALTQTLAGTSQSTIIVLDEAEDIFQTDHSSDQARTQTRGKESKAWINQLLETNRHPVIWISNQIDHLDPAYLRRFTYVVEFKTPNRKGRYEMVQRLMQPGASPSELALGELAAIALSRQASLTPAMLASAKRFALLSTQQERDGNSSNADLHDQLIVHHIESQISAMGEKLVKIASLRKHKLDPELLNLKGSFPPDRIIQTLITLRKGNCLLAGPPGTGKTQFALHIAELTGLDLIVKTAADLNSMWHGQSERNVAKLFEECDPESEMIFVDEADALLGSRSELRLGSNPAVVAEFLRRLESFEGLFLCATNEAAAIDQAVTRRLLFRIEFLPLTLPQRLDLFSRTLAATNLPSEVEAKLEKLNQLVPGDFVAVHRRMNALANISNQDIDQGEFLCELEAEHSLKTGTRPKIGF